MLGLDTKAITELLEIEAVPACNMLKSILGRSAKITITGIEKNDGGHLLESLPHFHVVIEAERSSENGRISQLYIFKQEDMMCLSNYMMGMPVDTERPLDEMALSVLKEAASQCFHAAIHELGDFLGKEMDEVVTHIAVQDGIEQIRETVDTWETDGSLVQIDFHIEIEGLHSFDFYGLAPKQLQAVMGIPSLEEEGQKYQGKTIAVQEVSFPEFKYEAVEQTIEHIGEEQKKLLGITLDVSVQIGGTSCRVKDILALKEGQVLTLDKQAGSPVDIVVNGQLIGKGDIMVTGDKFAARITEIAGKRE